MSTHLTGVIFPLHLQNFHQLKIIFLNYPDECIVSAPWVHEEDVGGVMKDWVHAERGSSDGGEDSEMVLEVAREVKDTYWKRIRHEEKRLIDLLEMGVFESLLAPDLLPRTHVQTSKVSIMSHYNKLCTQNKKLSSIIRDGCHVIVVQIKYKCYSF